MARARTHLEFVCALYRMQHKRGDYFIHEHPQGTASWVENCVRRVIHETGAIVTTIHQCMYGLTTTNNEGEVMPARKATNLMSNMPSLPLVVNKRCDGSHQHAVLEGGKRTKAAQEYPKLYAENL